MLIALVLVNNDNTCEQPPLAQTHEHYNSVIMKSHFLKYSLTFRAEPLLARIQADRTLVLSPVFDKVNYYDLEVVNYDTYAHGFDWALWCMYVPFPQKWYDQKDPSQPGK